MATTSIRPADKAILDNGRLKLEWDAYFSRLESRLGEVESSLSAAIETSWKVIASSGVAVSHTGNTDETILATIPLSAGAMGANGALRVTCYFSMTNDASNKTPRLRLGGIGGTAFHSFAVASAAGYAFQRIIHNRNSQSSQVSFPELNSTTFGTTGLAMTTGTIDTSQAVDLVITGELADSADTISLQMYNVELFTAN